jgi:hypothetical protein
MPELNTKEYTVDLGGLSLNERVAKIEAFNKWFSTECDQSNENLIMELTFPCKEGFEKQLNTMYLPQMGQSYVKAWGHNNIVYAVVSIPLPANCGFYLGTEVKAPKAAGGLILSCASWEVDLLELSEFNLYWD